MAIRKYVLMIIFLLTSVSMYAQQATPKKVLFVGNSLTYYNGMPAYLAAMLAHKKQLITVEVSAYPGMSLDSHLNDMIESRSDRDHMRVRTKKPGERTETEKKLASDQWDILILQEATVRLLIPEVRNQLVIPAINTIRTLTNNRPTIVLFKTWTSVQDYPVTHCYPSILVDKSLTKASCCSPTFTRLEEEQRALGAAFDSTALCTHSRTIAIGQTVEKAMRAYPQLHLLADKMHPTKTGAYLNACLFYQFLTGLKASTIDYTGDLDEQTAGLLQQIADEANDK